MKYLLIMILSFSLHARENPEAFYQDLVAKELKGKTEVVLKDKTRVDILTTSHAIEVDFADKWAEGIMTDLDAGLILIVEKESDDKHVQRVLNLLTKKSLRIKLWVYRLQNKMLFEFP
jgi:hypothetical protein